VYVLDTNAIIYYIDDQPAVVEVLENLFLQDVTLYVSTVTELELFSYPSLTEQDEARFRRKVQMKTSDSITLCDLCSQGVELFSGRL